MEPNPYESPKSVPAVQPRFAGLWKRVTVVLVIVGSSILGGSLLGSIVAAIGCGVWWWIHDHQMPPREEWLDIAIAGIGFGAEFGWMVGFVSAMVWWARSPNQATISASVSDK